MRLLTAGMILTLVLGIFCGLAYAETGSIALVGRAGSRGLGGEIVAGLKDDLNVRAGLSGFKYSYTGTEDDIKYDLDLGLLTASGLVDWHMLRGGFRLTGGFMLNKNKLDAVAVPSQSYKIGDGDYSAGEITSLTGRIDFNDIAAYLGLGWGNAVGKDKKLGFAVDVGAVFQGSANVKLDANSTGLADALQGELNANLRKEEANMQEDLKPFKYYPEISIGLTYKIK